MMAENAPDPRVAPFLARVLDGAGQAVGTCFQLQPCVLVTAFHVVEDLGAGEIGEAVALDPLAGGRAFAATVVAIDPLHDLAVLRADVALASSIPGVAATDGVKLDTRVLVTGVAEVEDPGRDYRFLDAPGTWQGGTTRDGVVALGRLKADSVVPGMSGAPVRRLADDIVVGVVSGRYNSPDDWLIHTVWVARTENLRPLLADTLVIDVHGVLEASVLSIDEAKHKALQTRVDSLAKQMSIHSRSLDKLQLERAKYGGLGVPLILDNQIEEVEAAISRIEVLLSQIKNELS